ncbi:hypothetical protein ACFSHQ_19125 [Gemmobacter lanyuensis]
MGQIHTFGRQMAAAFAGWTSFCRPRWPNRPPPSAALITAPRITWDIAPAPAGSSNIPLLRRLQRERTACGLSPLGFSSMGLPIGVHLAAPFGADEELIALCAEVEKCGDWLARKPPHRVK